MKKIEWLGSSRDNLRAFPPQARNRAGYALEYIQRGEMPADIKAVKEVGSGTFEIRIWAGDTFRVFFVAKFPEAVYVLHAFQKKTEKTSERDIRIGRERHNEMMNERRKLT